MSEPEPASSWWSLAHREAYPEFYRRCAAEQERIQRLGQSFDATASDMAQHRLTRSQHRRAAALLEEEV